MYPRASDYLKSGGHSMLSCYVLAILLIIIPLAGCSSIKTGKNIAIDSPLKESRTKQSMSEARQDVEKTRRDLDDCLANNSGDESKCVSEKGKYDEAVEEYVSYQTN